MNWVFVLPKDMLFSFFNPQLLVIPLNFVAISGGETDNNSVSIPLDGSKTFRLLEPGTYRMDIAVDGGAVFVYDPSLTLEAKTSYPLILLDGHIP
jgi:hypothetical protein